ncbi:MAG TPA: acetyltransferase [bacterium]|nr:acetyltransferase [bacterium]HPQ20106.1 acetyltransferase [bacterium]
MKDLIIVGGGCLARIGIDMLEEFYSDEYKIIGYVALEKSEEITNYEYLGNDEALEKFSGKVKYALNCVGTDKSNNIRRKIYNNMVAKNFEGINLIDPSARLSRSVKLGRNILIMKNVSIAINVEIGDNVIIYPNSTIDHDCKIGSHSHICPGVIMAGNITVGEAVFLGIGCVISNKIEIGDNTIIGAGAVVIKNIEANTIYKGFRS